MKKISTHKIALTVSSILIGTTFLNVSYAQDNVGIKSTVTTIEQSTKTGRLVQIGVPISSEPLKGFARDLSLLAVLRQITPNGWVVKKNDSNGHSLNVQKLVSWQGGNSWVNTLENIAINNSLDVLVNWDKKSITVSDFTPPVIKIVEVKKEALFILESDNNSTDIAVGNSQQTEAKLPVVPVLAPVIVPVILPVVESWQIKAGSSLKENVIAMATRAGYKVVWNAKDYPADDDRVLFGSFESEDGPIKQLAIDYGPESRVQQPLSFVFFQNKTLVVENQKFEQSSNPQYIHRTNSN